MDAPETLWLAGLLEGEGFFGTIKCYQKLASGEKRCYRYPRVGVGMVDRDVIERVAKLWDVKPFVQKLDSKKDFYRVTISGRHAVEVMEALRPHMGERRGSAIDAALKEWYARKDPNERRRKESTKAAKRRSRSARGTFVRG